MSYIVWFKDIRKDSSSKVGSKAALLGELYHLSLPVPEGFVIAQEAYYDFIAKAGLAVKIREELAALPCNDLTAMDAAAQKIQQSIVNAEIPKEIVEEIIDNYELLGVNLRKAQDLVAAKHSSVAVRCSPVEDGLMAGTSPFFLNLHAQDDIIRAVKNCWALAFTSQAFYYRLKNDIPYEKAFTSIIIQRMVNSSQSGIMFTVNPVTSDTSEILIEAVHGLNYSITQGMVEPERYAVEKHSRSIKQVERRKYESGIFINPLSGVLKQVIQQELRERKVLADSHIYELARLGRKIEDHFGKPQDIEWAIEQNQVQLLQTRPMRLI